MQQNFRALRRAIRRISAVVALGFGAISAACAQQTSGGVLAAIPMTMSRGHLFVAVQVNGRPATFIVDTGSGANIVDAGAASRLGVTASQNGGSAVVTGGGGTSRAYPAVVATMRVGNLLLQKSPVFLLHVSESVKCDGLLGYEFLRKFVVTFDFESGLMTLRRPAAIPAGQSVIPFVLSGGLPTVSGAVGGWPGSFQIDTGYNGTVVVNAPFVAKYHLRDRYAREGRIVNGRGVGGATLGDLVNLDSFQLGRVPLDGVTAELSRQTQGAFVDSKVAGIVGMGVLGRYTMTLDYPGSRLILTANGRRP